MDFNYFSIFKQDNSPVVTSCERGRKQGMIKMYNISVFSDGDLTYVQHIFTMLVVAGRVNVLMMNTKH